MELILVAHILGDFYAQTGKMADRKKQSIRYMLLHCLLYTIVTGAGFCILYGQSWDILKSMCVIFLSHLVVDWTKGKCEGIFTKRKCSIFLIDQIIHILILFLIIEICGKNFAFQMDSCLLINGLDMRTCMIVALAVLVCAKPAAIFVALVFEMIPETIEQADKETGEKTADEGARIGSWIGILEREIILTLGFMGQFGAIGFVLTAKSLARFKQLENKSFAEKYLVGTLLSALIAIGCVAFSCIQVSS